jgi:purine-binding chemotaxis protein CheW
MTQLIESREPGTDLAVREESEIQQFLTFMLKGEIFGLNILPIKEIIEFGKITPVPMVPGYVRGVVNIRGAVVPILDLSARFGWESSDITKRSCIVIAEVEQDQGSLDIGLVIDSVSEVIDIPNEAIKAPPSFGAKIDSDFITGMAKLNDELVILLNPNRILSAGQLGQISSVTDQALA